MSDISTTADWTDSEWKNFNDWLTGVLQTGVATVIFTKKDGTERVMRCTLDRKLLPPAPVIAEGSDKPARKKSETSIAAYDVDIKDWRSFTLKSVMSVHLSIG